MFANSGFGPLGEGSTAPGLNGMYLGAGAVVGTFSPGIFRKGVENWPEGPIDELCAAEKDCWCGISGGTDPLGRVISDASKSEPGDKFAVAAGEGSGMSLLLGVVNPVNCGFEGRPTGTGFCWNQPIRGHSSSIYIA